jgi:hypothetical protein
MAMTIQEIDSVANKTWLRSDPVNASLNNVPLLYKLKEQGRFKLEGMSAGIRVPSTQTSQQVSATNGSGDGMTVYDNRVNYSAEVQYKTFPAKCVIPKDMLDLSKSRDEVVSSILGVMVSRQSGILNTINNAIFSDGTLDNGYSIDGLEVAISRTPEVGSYGAIDPAVVSGWRNLAINALDPNSGIPEAGLGISKTNILQVMSYIINKLSLNGRTCSHILVGDYWYNMIDEVIDNRQQITTTDTKTNAGFRTISYKGVEIINCGGLQRTSSGAYSGIADKEMYFIAMDDLYLVYHNPYNYNNEASKFGLKKEEINAIVYPEMANGMILHKNPDNLDYYINLVFKGNLILGDRRLHGVLFESDIS